MRRGVACTYLVGLASLVAAAPASAAHHLVKISEVYPGSAAVPGADYLELQLTAAGENQVTFGGGSSVNLYDAAGSSAASNSFGSNPPNGGNQRTILAGCPLVESTFTVTLDLVLACPFGISGSGGSACFNSVPFGSLDCVRWGAATVAPAGTSLTGTPEAAIPDGQSLTRSIAAGCGSLHEFSDDTNDSANDFAPTTPSPRPNSVTPTETTCTAPPTDSDGDGVPNTSDACPNQPASTPNGCPADGGGGGDTASPDQRLTGPKTQDVDKLFLRVSSDEDATVVGTGTVSIPGAARVLRFRKVTKSVTAGGRVKLRYKLARGALRAVKEALEDGTRKARLKVTATDAAGNSSVARRTVTLRN